jgi:hypothetical protein
MDKEIRAMEQIADALSELDKEAAARVLRWAADRHRITEILGWQDNESRVKPTQAEMPSAVATPAKAASETAMPDKGRPQSAAEAERPAAQQARPVAASGQPAEAAKPAAASGRPTERPTPEAASPSQPVAKPTQRVAAPAEATPARAQKKRMPPAYVVRRKDSGTSATSASSAQRPVAKSTGKPVARPAASDDKRTATPETRDGKPVAKPVAKPASPEKKHDDNRPSFLDTGFRMASGKQAPEKTRDRGKKQGEGDD